MIIFDADILSIFAKINRLALIKKLLGTIYITPMIREELTVPLEYGYDFPKDILNHSSVIIPSGEDLSPGREKGTALFLEIKVEKRDRLLLG